MSLWDWIILITTHFGGQNEIPSARNRFCYWFSVCLCDAHPLTTHTLSRDGVVSRRNPESAQGDVST